MIVTLNANGWTTAIGEADRVAAGAALENGAVVHFPRLAFTVAAEERRLFSTGVAGSGKNVSFTPATGRVAGSDAAGADAELVARVLGRFSVSATALVRTWFPRYAPLLVVGRASFRPAEIAGRQTSWRKDDTRLHVDSFPSAPTGGRRILRVFTNVNPHGRPRSWRLGDSFAAIAARYESCLRLPWPGQAALLHLLHVTKARRTPYDALMLQLHDLMKRDDAYQRAHHASIDFAPGATWVAFTDEAAHAATAGQYQFEQTILVPIEAMAEPARSPLRVLEAMIGRRLA